MTKFQEMITDYLNDKNFGNDFSLILDVVSEDEGCPRHILAETLRSQFIIENGKIIGAKTK